LQWIQGTDWPQSVKDPIHALPLRFCENKSKAQFFLSKINSLRIYLERQGLFRGRSGLGCLLGPSSTLYPIRLIARGIIEGSKKPFFPSSLTPRNKSIFLKNIPWELFFQRSRYTSITVNL
jgi:hypothetical protein